MESSYAPSQRLRSSLMCFAKSAKRQRKTFVIFGDAWFLMFSYQTRTIIPAIMHFLHGRTGWRLSPAYDMNLSPLEIGGGTHNMAFNEEERTGSLEILLPVSEYFGVNLASAKQIAAEVAAAVSDWPGAVKRMERVGKITIRRSEIEKVSSAFRTDEIEAALIYRTSVESPEGKKRKKSRRRASAPNQVQ